MMPCLTLDTDRKPLLWHFIEPGPDSLVSKESPWTWEPACGLDAILKDQGSPTQEYSTEGGEE